MKQRGSAIVFALTLINTPKLIHILFGLSHFSLVNVIVFGKMAHFERYSDGIYRNVAGTHYQPIFKGAVQYYK